MNTSIWLVAIPDEFSVQKRIDLKVLMKRAIRVEERMVKGVQIEDEQKRYHTLCDRIEYLGNLISAENPVVSCELGIDYFEFLIDMSSTYPEASKAARLMSNFCPAELVANQLNLFIELAEKAGVAGRSDVQRKIGFYQEAVRNNWSVIELLQQKSGNDETLHLVEEKGNLKEQFLSLKVPDTISTGGDNSGPFVLLRRQIEKSASLIRQGMAASVDFSDLRHDVITEILHEFVYMAGRPLEIPVLYGDGSKAPPFPMYCLRNRTSQAIKIFNGMPILNVGMMSARHHELDNRVKVYWFRNQEISIGRTMGETDKVAYERAKELLIKTRSEGLYRIGFYQTGFQPAVVGFYRALTEELQYRANEPISMEVTPFYFLGGEYRRGKVWC